MCRFCDSSNLRFRDVVLDAQENLGDLKMVMRAHEYRGFPTLQIVAHCGNCISAVSYQPKYCPECGRDLRKNMKETT